MFASETSGRTTESDETVRPAPERVRVEAIEGPGRGVSALLGAVPITVGSAPSCDLCLDDPTVSRKHVRFELSPTGVTVRDLGSRNGTRFLSAKVEKAHVPVGGSIRVGHTVLRFSPAPAGDLPLVAPRVLPATYKELRDSLLLEFEKDYLASLIARCDGNLSLAAREAGLARSHLYRLLARHKLADDAGAAELSEVSEAAPQERTGRPDDEVTDSAGTPTK